MTAVRSPFADGETASVPLLFLVGAARTAGPRAADPLRRWWILPSAGAVPEGEDAAYIGRVGAADDVGAAIPVTIALADPLISGRHARVAWEDGALVVEDLGSKNGTFVDGARLTAPCRLAEGAVLAVGDHVLLHRMVSPNALLALDEEAGAPLGPVPSASPALALTTQKLRRLAAGGQELLLTGETGVGKEIYARAVHASSGRRGAFVAVNCAALPRDLVESELFGYRAGAHSTARGDKPGLIERAQAGTLFLDEIGELPQEGQAKLLRFLQDRELLPLGGQKPRRIEVAVVAATNQVIDPAGGGALRVDLIGRLGAPVVLPPLRERREDLGALSRCFLDRAGQDGRAAIPAFEGPAFRALCQYDFPLNVRELEKALTAAVALTRGERPIALRDLPAGFALAAETRVTDPALPASMSTRPGDSTGVAPVAPAGRRPSAPGPSAAELEALLAKHQGNVAEVSRVLGRQRAAVWRWIKRFGLGVDRHRGPGGGDGEPPPDQGDPGDTDP